MFTLYFAKQLAIKNLDFLINSAVNLHSIYPAHGFQDTAEKISKIKNDVQIQGEIKDTIEIQKFMKKFTTAEFSKSHFFNKDFSNKLNEFLAMLDQLVNDNAAEVVNRYFSY
jgi:hypothetical protein